MKKLRAFTMIEVLIVVVILAIGLILPALGGSHPAYKMKNSSQMKGIMTAFAMWSDANAGTHELPGGITPATFSCPANATDPSVVARFWALIAARGIDPLNAKMLVNPKPGVVPETIRNNPAVTVEPGVTTAAAADFSSNNVSYALLSTKMGSEWHDNTNASCPMICDRNRGTPVAPESSWCPSGWFTAGSWQGSVAWGDIHATFEMSPIVNVTIYGNAYPTSNLWAPASKTNAGMVNPGF